MVSACNKDQACSFRAMGCFAAEREFSLHVGVACLVCVCMHTRMSVCVRETACWAGLCILFSLPSVFLQNTLLKEYGGEGGGSESRMNGCVESRRMGQDVEIFSDSLYSL